jgi:hypothetical protein
MASVFNGLVSHQATAWDQSKTGRKNIKKNHHPMKSDSQDL